MGTSNTLMEAQNQKSQNIKLQTKFRVSGLGTTSENVSQQAGWETPQG